MDSRKLKKSIFKANFYESRRLRRDGFIDYMVRDTNSRKIYTKPFSIARKLFSFLGILFMFGFYGFLFVEKICVENMMQRFLILVS